MAAYDSDSSGGEDNDYTETNVLLGYASKEPQDDTITHLGGQPEWLGASTPPPASLAKCKVCNDLMVLILQLNGDLPEVFPGHERRLYILTCRRKTCRRKEGSVRALRGTRISEAAASASKPKQAKGKEEKEVEIPKPEAKPAVNLGESLFGAKPSVSGSGNVNPFATGSGMNPFSTSSAQSNPFAAAGLPTSELAAKAPQNPTPATNENETGKQTENLPKTFASVLSLNNTPSSSSTPAPEPSEPYPSSPSLLPTPYPTLYLIDADYETLDATPLPTPPQNTSIMDLDTDPSSSSAGGKEDKEVFESTHDTTFQKFADRLAQNPEQVLRYEFRGEPLLYSKTDAVGKLFSSSSSSSSGKITTTTNGTASGAKLPRCGNCGKGRVFEAQVTPHAILELEREEEGLDGMEWGTLILGVCEGDCVPRGVEAGRTGYVEEWVGVQWEELGGRR
ncbi:hypothetical protein CJF30_00007113 [Rutstroemia sp. NJR-2017a BBW]|nr:hypothetical protein CJF30_00007113 [Rutstroemia sp. NJR-2017a BBW]